MTDFPRLLQTLTGAGVEFIVVGGVAASAHGSARSTRDLDIVYRRTADNIRRLVSALHPFHPYLRGAPPGLPFLWEDRTIKAGLNFTLQTDIGEIDLLGEVTGGGGYDDLVDDCIRVQAFGFECQCLGLPKLIHVKRAAGRPRDLEVIAELEAILEEKQRG
jgi:predicted nucleotidyltransferase